MTRGMEESTFSLSGIELIAFIRDEFADFAIEAYKIEKDRSTLGRDVMCLCILDILSLLHPYAPHITETLSGILRRDSKLLALSSWPLTELSREKEAEDEMTRIAGIVRTIRNIRAESGVNPGEYRNVIVVTPPIYYDSLEANASLIKGLARIETLTLETRAQKGIGYAYGLVHGIDIYVDARIDSSKVEEEQARLSLQIMQKKDYIRTLTAKLKNNAFISNAPEKIVRIEMEKLHMTENELTKLEEKYRHLG